MTISAAFVNLKPGTTKTTGAVFLSAALTALGLRVLMVDADRAGSAQRWNELAQGFPWATVGMSTTTIARDLPKLLTRHEVDAVVVDTPQMEDHAAITRGAMSVVKTWIVPVAPAGIEIDRTMMVVRHMDEVQAVIGHTPERLALLTRTNRRRPSKTPTAPDASARRALESIGLEVFLDQVPIHDDLYRQTYNVTPDADGTPYMSLAHHLMVRAGMQRGLRAV